MVRRRVLVDTMGTAAVLALVAVGCTDAEPAPASTTSQQADPATSTATDTPTATATDASTCFPDATPVAIPAELSNLALPDRTRVYDIEVRGDNGVMLRGVTNLLFRAAVFQMRARYDVAPFTIVGFDEGESAVGANWTGPSISGRWVVEDVTPVCPGDTEVEILWTPAGALAD